MGDRSTPDVESSIWIARPPEEMRIFMLVMKRRIGGQLAGELEKLKAIMEA